MSLQETVEELESDSFELRKETRDGIRISKHGTLKLLAYDSAGFWLGAISGTAAVLTGITLLAVALPDNTLFSLLQAQ